jgi:hypothetical protein
MAAGAELVETEVVDQDQQNVRRPALHGVLRL